MAVLLKSLASGYYKLMYEYADPRVNDLPLMASPLPMLLILVTYHYFISHWGPRMMKNRRPFDMYYPMLIYNYIQIATNGWFVYKAFTVIWIPRRYNLVCEPVDYSNNPVAVEVAFYSWLYFSVKILDLFDTVFMVLRKKDRQVSFLHRYHHIGMVLAGWIGTKYVAGGHAVFFGTVNSLVHTIMYFYYQLMLVKPEYRASVWWKKHITEVQLVQFVVTTVHATSGLLSPDCGFPKYLLGAFIPQDIFMFFLFLDFYRKAYWPKNKKSTAEETKLH